MKCFAISCDACIEETKTEYFCDFLNTKIPVIFVGPGFLNWECLAVHYPDSVNTILTFKHVASPTDFSSGSQYVESEQG